MIGEALALFSAACFGLAGVTIARGAATAQGDNGAFLSIVLTAACGGGLWLLIGTGALPPPGDAAVLLGVAYFVIGGVLSTVLGRLTMFRSVVLAGAISASLFRRLIPVFAAVFAWALLGETVGGMAALGMGVVMASVLIAMTERLPLIRTDDAAADAAAVADRRKGRLFGAASSACYGGSYVARKLGMIHIPDAALGALIGAVTGIVWYLAAAIGSARYRRALTGVLRDSGRWQVITASAMAIGQTSQFFALAHTDVATVAIINSTEVFISIWLAAFVFRTEARPSRRVVLASVIAVVGVVIIALA
ncbi:MAG: DMT family transporter [Pararhodobacter sp.]|nr:DMT family transporter [Pararhodobacter sp.]